MSRIALFGSSDFGIPSFAAVVADQDSQVVGVVTQPPRPAGRRGDITPTPVDRWATEAGLNIFRFASLKDSTATAALAALRADIFLVAAYGLILPPTILTLPSRGCINIHASLLPAYRGASPIPAAILHGDQRTGVTFMLMDEGIDTGPLLASFETAISPQDTTMSLAAKLSSLAAAHILAVLHQWQTSQTTIPQPSQGISYVKKISTADGQIDWRDGRLIERQWRAYSPWPGIWSTWNEQRLKFIDLAFIPKNQSAVPGTVIADDNPSGWAVVCGQGLIIPRRVQREGKNAQDGRSFLAGYPSLIGSVLR